MKPLVGDLGHSYGVRRHRAADEFLEATPKPARVLVGLAEASTRRGRGRGIREMKSPPPSRILRRRWKSFFDRRYGYYRRRQPRNPDVAMRVRPASTTPRLRTTYSLGYLAARLQLPERGPAPRCRAARSGGAPEAHVASGYEVIVWPTSVAAPSGSRSSSRCTTKERYVGEVVGALSGEGTADRAGDHRRRERQQATDLARSCDVRDRPGVPVISKTAPRGKGTRYARGTRGRDRNHHA